MIFFMIASKDSRRKLVGKWYSIEIGNVDCDLDRKDYSVLNCFVSRWHKNLDLVVHGHDIWRLTGEKLGAVGIHYKDENRFGTEDLWFRNKNNTMENLKDTNRLV